MLPLADRQGRNVEDEVAGGTIWRKGTENVRFAVEEDVEKRERSAIARTISGS